MKIEHIEPTIVSVPYSHRETSSRVQRDGVTAVVTKITTDNGLVGWGESCPGPNVESVYEAVKSTIPLFTGRNPWERDAITADFYGTAHWYHREMTGHFAFAGLDIALQYATRRRAFGQATIEFQGLQWMLADVATDLEAARLLTRAAAQAIDHGHGTVAASHAKKFATRAAVKGLADCMQVMGAAGFKSDQPLGRHLAGAKMAHYLDGTTEIQNLIIARDLVRYFN